MWGCEIRTGFDTKPFFQEGLVTKKPERERTRGLSGFENATFSRLEWTRDVTRKMQEHAVAPGDEVVAHCTLAGQKSDYPQVVNPQLFGCYVTQYSLHKALKLIS